MALKRKPSQEEQLYMLEVLIDRLDIRPNKNPSSNHGNLIVRVRLDGLISCEINLPQKDSNGPKNRESAADSAERKNGKACLFAKRPDALVRAMKSMPLHFDVYREESARVPETDRIPVCTAKLSLPGCLREKVIATRNETDALQTPCGVSDTLELIDSTGNPSGNASIVLRLSCLGSSIVKHFSLNDKSFVQEAPLEEKFPNAAGRNSKDKTLKRPRSPPRVSMDEPGFDNLTTAEKLNDPKYRELIYRAYPDEPTCCCLPTNRTTHPMTCPSGCSGPCCMRLRDPKILLKRSKKKEKPGATYCVNNLRLDRKRDTPCRKARLRGGGDVEQIYVGPSYGWTDYDVDYSWCDDTNTETRLEGGGEEKSNCACLGQNAVQGSSREGNAVRGSPREGNAVRGSPLEGNAAVQDACKPVSRSAGGKVGCVCPGKETGAWKRGGAKCTKKPCQGVDCLIRAFQEAQDFVDSLGKVPGLAGLGLMDPSESPFFGRDIDKDYPSQETQQGERRKGQQPGAAVQCGAPCNTQIGKPITGADHVPMHYAPATPVTIVPGRTGVVREAIPTLPKTSSVLTPVKMKKREERKEERAEKKDHDMTDSAQMDGDVGPCGEPKCKSRRKKPVEVTTSQEISDVPQKRNSVQVKRAPVAKSSRGSEKATEKVFERKHKVRQNVMGPGGDQRNQREQRSEREQEPRSPREQREPRSQREQREPRNPRDQRNQRSQSDYRSQRDRPTASGRPDRDQHDQRYPRGINATRSDRDVQAPIKVSKRVMKYVYTIGDVYPGINYGHQNCIEPRIRVPANMGWLWNTTNIAGNLKPRIGWKPGAIARFLNEMLKEAKAGSLQEVTTYTRKNTSSANRPRSMPAQSNRPRSVPASLPTEKSSRKGQPQQKNATSAKTPSTRNQASSSTRNQTSSSTRNQAAPSPRNQASPKNQTSSKVQPATKAQPVQKPKAFKSTTSFTSTKKGQQRKEAEEDDDSPPTLHIHRKDGTYYVTMYPIKQETADVEQLDEPMKPLQFKIVKNKDDTSIASSSTASDMEIEFSPPAAVSRHRRKPDVIHVDTQVRQQEILDAYKPADGQKKKEKKVKKDKKPKK